MGVTEVHLICVLFIGLFNNQMLGPYYMVGTVLGFGKTELKSPCPSETHIPLGKTENKMYI